MTLTGDNEQDHALMKLLSEVKAQGRTTTAANMPVKEWSPEPPEPEICVAAIVQAGANLPLAAERLGIPEEQLVSIISTDPTAPGQLMAQMRTMATLKAMATLNIVEAELQGKIPLMDPYDLSKTYTALLDKVVTATDRNEHTENINIAQIAMSQLPPAARAAMKSLIDEMNNPQDQPNIPATVIDHDYEVDADD